MTYIEMTEIRDTGKTKVWSVDNSNDGSHLGEIKWRGGWRKYVLAVEADTVWSSDCLKDVAEFIEVEMRARRKTERLCVTHGGSIWPLAESRCAAGDPWDDGLACANPEQTKFSADEERCTYCRGVYPKPVHLHHSEEECHVGEPDWPDAARTQPAPDKERGVVEIMGDLIQSVKSREELRSGGHNHFTRDIKPAGQCPGCDRRRADPMDLGVPPFERTVYIDFENPHTEQEM